MTTAAPPKANVYVDGFNLYYGCLKGTVFRWLDLGALCSHLLPGRTIQRIRYFTARVSGGQALRQQVYLRALGTIPTLSIHEGQYYSHDVWMPAALAVPAAPASLPAMQHWFNGKWHSLLNPIPNWNVRSRVRKTEEKGSDVNLATQLLVDAYEKDFDEAVVISNDSDLRAPIEVVIKKLGLPVHVFNPHRHPSQVLTQVASSVKQIRPGLLQLSQFPATLTDAKGPITKPVTW